MAIYRCELKVYSRGKASSATAAAAYVTGSKVSGRGGNSGKVSVKSVSAVEASAYRASEKLQDVAAERVHDYSRKENVLWSGIMAPEGAPAWARDRGQLWNTVEAAEKRKDAQLFRECLVSIPRELSPEAGRKLVQNFVQSQFVDRGMVADIGIHSPKASDGELNPHAHIMLTMRDLKGDGFGNKRRDWNEVQWQGKGAGTARQGGFLQNLRTAWEAACNKALAEAGDGARVDHRSLKEQGIDRAPQPKLGKARHATPDKRGRQSAERTAAWLGHVHGKAGEVRDYNALVQCGRAAGRAFFRHNLAVGAELANALLTEIDADLAAAGTTTLTITGHGPGRPDADIWGHDDGGPGVG